MAYTNPAYQDFVSAFSRDFPFSSDPAQGVTPTDVASSFAWVNATINQALFSDQASYNLGYLYLTAHELVMNMRASSQGLQGQYHWASNNAAVAGISEGYEIPERIKNFPLMMDLSKSYYGIKYLRLILPFLCGQMFSVHRRTLP